jgi:hypothetical protein
MHRELRVRGIASGRQLQRLCVHVERKRCVGAGATRHEHVYGVPEGRELRVQVQRMELHAACAVEWRNPKSAKSYNAHRPMFRSERRTTICVTPICFVQRARRLVTTIAAVAAVAVLSCTERGNVFVLDQCRKCRLAHTGLCCRRTRRDASSTPSDPAPWRYRWTFGSPQKLRQRHEEQGDEDAFSMFRDHHCYGLLRRDTILGNND